MILPLNQMYFKHNPTQTTADAVVLIYKGTRLARTEYPPWARPFVGPNGHALIKKINPQRNNIFFHVILPILNHLYHLPELVHKYKRQLIIICQLSDNFFKLCMDHRIFDTKRVTLLHLHPWQRPRWPKFLLAVSCHGLKKKNIYQSTWLDTQGREAHLASHLPTQL